MLGIRVLILIEGLRQELVHVHSFFYLGLQSFNLQFDSIAHFFRNETWHVLEILCRSDHVRFHLTYRRGGFVPEFVEGLLPRIPIPERLLNLVNILLGCLLAEELVVSRYHSPKGLHIGDHLICLRLHPLDRRHNFLVQLLVIIV